MIDGSAALFTLADIARKAEEESRVYSSVEIPINSLVVVFSAERSIRFWYVRTTGSGTDYGLWYVEDKMQADIGCTLTLRFREASGAATSDMIQKTVLDAVIQQPTYGDMTLPCDACRRRVFTENAVGDMFVYNDWSPDMDSPRPNDISAVFYADADWSRLALVIMDEDSKEQTEYRIFVSPASDHEEAYDLFLEIS